MNCPNCRADNYIYIPEQRPGIFGFEAAKGDFGCLNCGNVWSDTPEKEVEK